MASATTTLTVLCTDAGTDPDDLVAILAAMADPTLDVCAIVSASEEVGEPRFRMIRHVVRQLAGSQQYCPLVFAGLERPVPDGRRPYYCCESFPGPAPASHERFDAFVAYLHEMCAFGPVKYVAIGGCANLSAFLEAWPDDAKQLHVVAMLGDLNPESARAEFNVRMAPHAAIAVLRNTNLASLTLVPVCTTTHTREMEGVFGYDDLAVKRGHIMGSPLEIACRGTRVGQAFLDMYAANLETFMHNTTHMHDPMAVAVAAGALRARPARVAIGEDGQMRRVMTPQGNGVMVLQTAEASPSIFWLWMAANLRTF